MRELNLYKSLGPDRLHPRIERELSLKGLLPFVGGEDQGRTPVTGGNNMFHAPSERPKKTKLGNYKQLSFTLIPRKVTEQSKLGDYSLDWWTTR